MESEINNKIKNNNKINTLYKTLSLNNISLNSKSKKCIENKENLFFNNHNSSSNINNKNKANLTYLYDNVSKNSKSKLI